MPDILPGADRAKTFNQEIRTIVFADVYEFAPASMHKWVHDDMRAKSREIGHKPVLPSLDI
jgi:hypothetical protein